MCTNNIYVQLTRAKISLIDLYMSFFSFIIIFFEYVFGEQTKYDIENVLYVFGYQTKAYNVKLYKEKLSVFLYKDKRFVRSYHFKTFYSCVCFW